MINKILFFLGLLFAIEMVVVAVGLNDTSLMTADPLFTWDLDDMTNENTDVSVISYNTGEADEVINSSGIPSVLPEITEGYGQSKTILNRIGDLMFGWRHIFILLKIPAVISYGLVKLIALLQIFSAFYLIAYFIAALRGNV